MSGKPLSFEEKEKIAELISAGHTLAETARIIERSATAVSKYARKHNIEPVDKSKQKLLENRRKNARKARAHRGDYGNAEIGALCWYCKHTNRLKCTWFDSNAPVMPEGCDYTAKDVIYTGGNNKTKQVRRTVTLYTIKKCPNFEREAPRYEATGGLE